MSMTRGAEHETSNDSRPLRSARPRGGVGDSQLLAVALQNVKAAPSAKCQAPHYADQGLWIDGAGRQVRAERAC